MVLAFIVFDIKIENYYTEVDRNLAFKNLTKFGMKLLLTKQKHLTAYTSELQPMDKEQAMVSDAILLVAQHYESLFKTSIEFVFQYLKNDLKIKYDENFTLPFDEFMKIRKSTFATQPVVWGMMLLDGKHDFSEDQRLYKVPEFRRYADLLEDIITITNEIRSFNLEQSRNDHWGNGVTVLARERGVSLEESVEMMVQMLDDRITEFQTLGWRLVHSDLAQQFKHLQEIVEVAFPNFVYGYIHNADAIGRYKMGEKTCVDEKSTIGTRIDPALVFGRVKSVRKHAVIL